MGLDDTGQLLMTVEEGQSEKGCLRGESCAGSTEKRNRVVWTRELHACFLDAIKRVGIDLVVPKTILHAMGSPPGVSRESIASHLQKFRIWHRKVKAQGVLDEDLSVDDFLSQRGYEAPHSGTGSMSRRKRQAIMASMSSSGSSLEAGLSSSSSNNNNNNNSLNLTSGVATSGNTDSLPSGAAATAMTFTKNNDQLLAKGSKKKYQTTADKGTKKTDPLNSTAVVIKSDAMRQHLHGRGSNVETPEPAETAAAGAPLVQSSSTTSTASAASVVPMSTSGASPTAIVMVASATTSPSAITHEATGASNKLAGSATTISRPSAGSTTSASGTAVASAPSAISEDRTQTGFPGGVPARSKSGQPTKRLAPSSGGMTRAIVGRAPKVAKVWADQLTTKISANQSAIGPISSDDSAVQQQQQEGGCVHDAGLMSGFSCNPACLEGSGMPWQVVPDMDIPLLLPRVSLVEIPSASPCPVAANPHMVGLGVDDAVAGATGGNRSDDGTMARPGMGGGGGGMTAGRLMALPPLALPGTPSLVPDEAGLLDAALVLTPTALVGPALECEEPTAAQGGLYAGIVSEAAEDDDMAIYDLHSMFVMVEGEDDGGLVGEGVTGHLQEQVAHYPFVDVKVGTWGGIEGGAWTTWSGRRRHPRSCQVSLAGTRRDRWVWSRPRRGMILPRSEY
eukprot:jgi/Mesvir1/28415/Mv15844-RA.1